LEHVAQHHMPPLSDDSVEEMLALAERLREANGGELDESAIQAVAEATNAPVEYVRLAVRMRVEKTQKHPLAHLKAQFVALGPETRRYVLAGVAAAVAAMLNVLEMKVSQVTEAANNSSYGVFGMLSLVVLLMGAYNASLSRESRTAAIAGGIFAGGFYLTSAAFAMLFSLKAQFGEWALIPIAIAGAIGGLLSYRVMERHRAKLGLKDPVKDRQDLLRQLVDLQAKLRTNEQSLAFLSLDIVGSTKMKTAADPLAVEFTFNEYHSFVERIVKKHGGSVHSTAGDGIMCAFESGLSAFTAAKNIQSELIELNTFKNQIGVPIVLRAGIHEGKVFAADAGDVTTVNFTQVIDLAAHLEKACPPGGVAVSSAAAFSIPGGLNSVGDMRIRASDTDAAVWLPRHTLSLPDHATPPVPEIG
jgi:class 3 adenylate cyclase